MARRTHTYAIRLAVEGGGQVKAELVSVGKSGEQSLKRIESAGERHRGVERPRAPVGAAARRHPHAGRRADRGHDGRRPRCSGRPRPAQPRPWAGPQTRSGSPSRPCRSCASLPRCWASSSRRSTWRSVDTTTGLVTFGTAPAAGVEVTADFGFDVPVRFDTDHMAVIIETYRVHAWQQIQIVEVRL